AVRRAVPYANAVLRRVRDLGPDWPWPAGDDPDAVAVRSYHPRWIVDLLRRDLGDDTEAVLASANEPPAVTLRPNPLRTTAEALAAELTAGFDVPAAADVPPGFGAVAVEEPGPGRGHAIGRGVQIEAGRLVPSALLVRGVGDLAL